MKKNVERIMCLILVVVMLVAIFPAVDLSASTANVTLETRIRAGTAENAEEISSVASGEEFWLQTTYAFFPNSSSAAYKSPVLTVEIPKGIVVSKEGISINSDVSSYDIYTISGKTVALFQLNDDVDPGATKTISIRAAFEKMTTANNAEVEFVAKMDGQYAPDYENDKDNFVAFETVVSKSPMKSTASDEWQIEKTVDSYPNGGDRDWFFVKYKITVDLLNSMLSDRYGRLEFADGKYSVTDIFPVAPVRDGGAHFVEISADGIKMSEGVNFTKKEKADGTLESLTITDYNKLATEGGNIPAGASIRSDYYITVKFKKSAYETSSNQELKEYILKNNSTLKYTLVTTKDEVVKTSDADVTLGWYESIKGSFPITVQKMLSVGGREFPLDDKALANGYTTASFSLYMDEKCTKPAKDIKGAVITPAEKKTDNSGRVTFENLREGDYWLKETASPKGFGTMAQNPLKITLGSDGRVTYNGASGVTKVTVTDMATDTGIVEFWKKGIGSSDAGAVALKGVEFELLKNGAVIAAAASDDSGYVHFDALEAGTYEIREKSLPKELKGEYQILTGTKTVTVLGNDIVSPNSDIAAETGIILNRSQLGRLKIFKTDESKPAKNLAGAVFEIYGPFASMPQSGTKPIATATVSAEGWLSEPLEAGKYWIKETKAPAGYVCSSAWIEAEVASNTTKSVYVTNEAYSVLAIYKYGAWGTDLEYTGLSGATFKVYDAPVGGNVVTTLISTTDATGVPIWHSDNDETSFTTAAARVKAGTYYLEEVSAPVGYQKLDARIMVTLGKGETVIQKVTNYADYSRIRIRKTDSRSPYAPLKGVSFELYSDEKCTKLVEKMTTDANGVAMSRLLPVAGAKYYIKETSTPNGYVAETRVINGVTPEGMAAFDKTGIELANNSEVRIGVPNDKQVGITIVKKDSAPSSGGAAIYLGNVRFELYDKDPASSPAPAAIAAGTTKDKTGEVSFNGLTPGKTYWYKEVAAPSGYFVNANAVAFVAPSSADADAVLTVDVTNDKNATVVVRKQGLRDGKTVMLDGAEFELYPALSSDSAADRITAGTDVTKLVTSKGGSASAQNIRPGSYWLVETKAPEGFALDATVRSITVQSGDNTPGYRTIAHATVDDVPNAGRVRIKKVDSVTGGGVSATFKLYKKLADGSYETSETATIVTKNDGFGVSPWIAAGEYGLVESAVSGDYVKDTALRDVVVANGVTTGLDNPETIQNTPYGHIKIVKTATWSTGSETSVELLPGAVFEVFPRVSDNASADRLAAKADSIVGGLTTDVNGVVETKKLVPGSYWVKETSAPNGFELNGGYFSVTVPAGGFAEAKIDNVPKTGKIKILKVDKGTLALLAGAKFELYEVDDIGGKYISGGPSVKLTKVAGQPELLTDENGAALTTALNPTKIYYVRELADSPLIKSGYRMVAEWTGPIQISAPGIALAVVKNYKPAQGSGIKRDQDGAGLEGAVMGIFKNQKDAAAMNSWLRTNTLTEAALTKEFCAAMHIKSTAKSTQNGQFVFTDLVPGETYYIVELVAPQNYVRADVVKQATVAPGGNGFTVAPQFVNEKYGRIALLKQTELSGRRFSVEGAVFRIYKAVGTPTKPHLGNHVCDASCGLTKGELVYEGKTDSAGEILTVLLPSGDYLVEEESAPDNFTKSPDIYHLFVEVNEINSHLFTNPVLNTSGDGRFELTKHSSLDKAPDVTYLAATFKLQVFNGTSYVDYIPAGSSTVYTFTTSPSDKYLSGYLPIGKYKLVETVAPIGYTIGGTLEFEITKGTVTEKLEIKNDPQGKLLVAKYASFDGVRGAVMNNVKFGLFTNEACSGVPKYTALTSNGTATFANIDAGSYWLKELSVGGNAGYVVSDTVTPVTVKIGETVSLSGADAIVNVPVYGKLKIEKTDANDKTAKIKDAVFTIYDNKDCIGKSYGTIRTRADGTGTSGLLNPAKQYWLKETSVPAGYKMVNTGIYGPFTVTANGVNAPGNEQIVITNIKYQKVSLRKVSMLADGTKQPIGEVGFALFEKGADTSNLALAVAVEKTQADGSLTFENLMPNTEYVVRETSVPANHVDNTAALYNVTTSNSGLTEIGEIKNVLQGKIELLKFTKWTNAAGATTGEPLQFAKFSIFEKGADTSNPANARDTIVTDSNGFAASKYLDPGEYVVVETSAPTGFVIAGKNAYDITVESGKTNTQLKDNPIENVPQSGRFTVEKYAANTNPAVLLRGAVFELYHRVGGAYELYNAASPTFTVYGTYASGYMPAGEYMIKEIKAPAGCTLDATEHKFTVKVSTTTAVRVSNDLQGAVELKKISDAQNGSEPLAGARFQLWQGAVTTGKKVGGVAETNANGICRFDNLDAGAYYVEEISAPTGFAVNKNISPVTVEKKGEAATYYITVEDKADMGRIIVEKTSEKAPQKGLEGAQFEVWSVGTSTQPSVKIAGPFTTDASGFARTTLLPAQMLGTHYLVKETKAPDGYTLDSRLSKTEKTVKVMPILNPSANAATNFVSFTDMSESDIAPFPGKIVKTIVKTSEEKSLLLSDFEVTYRLDGYADGKNPLPLEGFTVTDNMLAMKHYNASGYALTFKDGDYSIKSVRIYKAKNANGGAVNAVTEYQTYEQLGTDSWTSLPSSYVRENLETLADGGFATVDLSNATNRSVMGVRVRYSGTNKNFTADGIELDVVFAKRASNAMRNEVRRIENTGSLDYTYTIFNSVHAAHAVSVSKPSNLVFSELPPMSADLVPVSLSNIAKNAGKTFVAGAAVEYTVTASNNAQDKKVFRDPIIAIDIPAYTTLDEGYNANSSFVITDETGRIIKPASVGYETVNAMTVDASGKLIPLLAADGTNVKTKRMFFIFDGMDIAPQGEISIKYRAIINSNKPSAVTELITPAFLSSSSKFPLSAENPLGLSFKNSAASGGLISNTTIDRGVDDIFASLGKGQVPGENRYVNANEAVSVTDDNALSIAKQIKGPFDNDYVNVGTKVYTYPGGDVWYKLTVTNNLASAVKTVRIVDLLPFFGDTYVIRNSNGTAIDRSTQLTKRPVLDSVNATGATVYYYVGDDWQKAQRTGPMTDELPMLYKSDSTIWNGWTTTAPTDMSEVTAVAFEKAYTADAPLKSGDSYTVEIKMTMPEYTAEEIDIFYDKMVSNSAAAAAVAVGDTDPEWRVENNQVINYMRLPVGAIGDYVFIDKNNNGVQDAKDEPIGKLGVTLYRTDYKSGQANATYIYKTTTDALGKYIFENLPCNLQKAGSAAGSKNPLDYIGEVYTSYRVSFDNPQHGLVPTLMNEGVDDAADSDINAALAVDDINLKVNYVNGVLKGEKNTTIDAGFVLPCSLGDYVWHDENRNGIQDAQESGIGGVTVNLYRTDAFGKPQGAPFATQLTDAVGHYDFQNLIQGDYMLEFDLSSLTKADGYTPRYYFTNAKMGASGVDDSDALTVMDTDDQIRRTEKIKLSATQNDMTWDAGLVVYSAIGGFCFDDVNYNDIHDLSIPLAGTIATLYRVTNGVPETTPLRAQEIVGMDGKYYFDKLIDGEYVVHFDFPAGYAAVNARVGSDTAIDSDVENNITPNMNQGDTRTIVLPYDTSDTTWDAGARLYGAIGDYVWYDDNSDGVQDAGEKAAAGVVVTLQRRHGYSDDFAFYGKTTTDSAGNYVFGGLMGGLDADYQYRVVIEPPDGYEITKLNATPDIKLDSDATPLFINKLGNPTDTIAIGYGQRDMTWDAGLIKVVSALGDYVWYDANKNGLQDAGEQVLPGIKVYLEYCPSGNIQDQNAWFFCAETLTGKTGQYLFENLREGYYRVAFDIPTSYSITKLERGSGKNANLTDSDGIYPAYNKARASGRAAAAPPMSVVAVKPADVKAYSGPTQRVATRSIYLDRGVKDLSWDIGVYAVQTGDEGFGLPWSYALAAIAAMAALAFAIFGMMGQRKKAAAAFGKKRWHR